jgi:pimeloyl-ACP methyl ester carboxylesterase
LQGERVTRAESGAGVSPAIVFGIRHDQITGATRRYQTVTRVSRACKNTVMPIAFATVPFRGQNLQIEYEWVNRELAGAPLVIFLHEGLGSVAMWRGFPQTFCNAGGFRGLIYSRYGYGQSSSRPRDQKWPVDFLDEEATELLPAFLQALNLNAEKPWLFGHSDGASIALIYAATFPNAVAGVIAVAAHIYVEEKSIRGIELLKSSYLSGGLRQRLVRYHANADAVFQGWSDIWLDLAFRGWNIEALLRAIRCPVLAVQGFEDEFAAMKHLEDVQRHIPHAELLKLQDCGHSPHRDQPEALTAAAIEFIRKNAALA